MARVLVTGATGFIGSHIARRLLAAGNEVVATGRDINRLSTLNEAGLHTIQGDLSFSQLSTMTDGADVIVHCAALSSPWGRREDFYSANVIATQRLLDAARRSCVRRFVHLSSPSIYFRLCDQLNTPEEFEAPRRWINAYAETKWLAELSVREAAVSGLPSVILRPRAVFGEGDRAIFPRLLSIAQRGWFPQIGDGRALIDVTYVANVVDVVLTAMKHEMPGDGRAFNITNAEPMHVNELLNHLFNALSLNVRRIRLPRRAAIVMGMASEAIAKVIPGRPEPRLSLYGVGVLGFSQTLDISAARVELGYIPKVSVTEGIQRFANWWKYLDQD